jgi:quercetin dioxygenase-like cupin family protein
LKSIRSVDFVAMNASDQRVSQRLLDRDTGAKTLTITAIKTPPGGGSPEGMHTHPVDQFFYILNGTMRVEIAEASYEVGVGALVSFPAGVPHRNWNASDEPTIHLSIASPLPEVGVPFTTPVAK